IGDFDVLDHAEDVGELKAKELDAFLLSPFEDLLLFARLRGSAASARQAFINHCQIVMRGPHRPGLKPRPSGDLRRQRRLDDPPSRLSPRRWARGARHEESEIRS